MIVPNKQFDSEVNKIANILSETENAKYFKRVDSVNGKPYLVSHYTPSVTPITKQTYALSICETSKAVENTNFSIYFPCLIVNDESYYYSPIEFKNILFYGAIEDSKHSYRLLLKVFFNQNNSVRNQIVTIKHLSLHKIFEIISLLNIATDRVNMDYFKFDDLDSPLLFINESLLIHKIISNMKFKIYEKYVNRPGRDDFFYLLKAIRNIPKNVYFKKLVETSLKALARSLLI